MGERLVDVSNSNETVLHTYPVTVDERHANNDNKFEEKAVLAASFDELVSDPRTLTTKMHVSRGGALTPYGDARNVHSQTKAGVEQSVRESAYYLWEREGCPEGRATEFWDRAHEQTIRERAYTLWQQEGCPEGRAEEIWQKTREFGTH